MKYISIFSLLAIMSVVILTSCSVKPTPKAPITIFSSCTSDECRERYYADLVGEEGINAAFSDLKEKYQNDSQVRAYCHQFTHVIGRTAAELYPNVTSAFEKGDSFCWSGYYHGVMETLLSKEPIQSIPEKINVICSGISGKVNYSFDYYNCVHGLGHGIMFVNANELFDALKMCEHMNGSWEQQSCASGAFMENVMVDNRNHFTKYLKPDKPFYPCTVVSEKWKSSCYLMQTSYVLKISNYNFSSVFEVCEQAGQYADICYRSLGRDASGNSVSNIEQTKATCLLGKNEIQQSNCVIGAVKDFISYHHSDTQAKQLCAVLPQNLQQTCYSSAEEYYKRF